MLVVTALATSIGGGLGGDLYGALKALIGIGDQETDSDDPFTVIVSADYTDVPGVALSKPLRRGDDAFALRRGIDSNEKWADLLARQGGAVIDELKVSFVFTGVRDTSVRITDMTIHKLATSPTLSGTAIYPYTQGEVGSIPVHADLDQPRPRILGKDGKPYFAAYDIDLAKDERVTVALSCQADAAMYRWVMSIDYVDDDGAHTVYVDRGGKLIESRDKVSLKSTFAVTGEAKSHTVVYEGNNSSPGFHVKP
ncbi:hypothetical protein [Streptomyces sp. NPDC002845]